MIPNNEPILKVSQVAKYLNISSDRLRTYDEEKLIITYRSSNNSRLYSNDDVEWLENLRKLIAKDNLTCSGFKEILKLLYFIPDDVFNKFVKTQSDNSVWKIIAEMKMNSNYEKLRSVYGQG